MSGEKGDCFQVAAGFTTSGMIEELAKYTRMPVIYSEKSPWRIVHGLPVGNGGEIQGKRYWHAWVELTTDEGVFVLDLSNNKDIRVPRTLFYAAGKLDEDHVWRFSPAEAKKLRRKHRHCGPWVPGWETMEDPSLQDA